MRVLRQPAKGFTLLEVMVAVAVLAIALSAIIKATGEGGANLSYLRDKTLAHWVAENRLAEMQATEQFKTGEERGSSEMAERDWYWQTRTSSTEIPNLHQVIVSVSDRKDAEQALATLTGFLADPELRRSAATGPAGGTEGNGDGTSGGESSGNSETPRAAEGAAPPSETTR